MVRDSVVVAEFLDGVPIVSRVLPLQLKALIK